MQQIVSKSQFKARVLGYLRQVERLKSPLVITHLGKPVVEVKPYIKAEPDILGALRGTVLKYDDPMEPVGVEDWEALK